MGLRTGVNLEQLLVMRKILEEGMPGEPLYGYVPLAGITKGFVPATRPH
jgi:hydroxymethylglutaryl-CoA lyase